MMSKELEQVAPTMSEKREQEKREDPEQEVIL